MSERPFLVSALVDFPDDCSKIPFNEELLTQLIDRLQWMGVRRVYWNYYHPGMWKWFIDRSPATRQTLERLGDPMLPARRLCHARGMELIAVIKPYETGVNDAHPKAELEKAGQAGLPGIGGSYLVDPWVLAHPEMRVRARSAGVPAGLEKTPVTRIQLRQKDMAPIRLRPENLEIWTSADNHGYRKQDVRFTLTESVDACPQDVVDMDGKLVTRQGDAVRVLDLGGLDLYDPFIAVTTNLDDAQGTFRNTAGEMLRAFGPGGKPLSIVVGSHRASWRPARDLRCDALPFDEGLGALEICLDVSNQRELLTGAVVGAATTNDGVIAFARGRNRYLAGSLCEAYPEVQAMWLGWVSDCIAAGVDGLDIRISCHSSWTNTPEIYGFNPPVCAEYRRRYGADPDREPYDPALLADLRGDFYDGFLAAARERLAAAGVATHLHLEAESFRADAAPGRVRTRPGNIQFHWRRWLRGGLADEATLFGRGWLPERVLGDDLTRDMLREASAAGVPAHLSEPVWMSRGDGRTLAGQIANAYHSGLVAGYTMYETSSMFDSQTLAADGRLAFVPGLCEAVREEVQKLGL